MKKIFFIALFFCGRLSAQQHKTILAIFAHPDDEVTMAPVLAKYASAGAEVYLAIATDGRLGVSGFAHIPAGDTLAAVRIEESRCAAAQLGIHPPIFMGLPDQLNLGSGYQGLVHSMDSIYKLVAGLLKSIHPDIIITWSPGGWTGHPDHCLVGNIVTSAYLGAHWKKVPKLFFARMPADRPIENGWTYSDADSAFLTVRIKLSPEDMTKAKRAWLCHKSQFRPEDVDRLQKMIWDMDKPVSYFIRFAPTGTVENSFFEPPAKK
jgi:LmbE family N-acetylglucosaminyl deacetylase